MPHFVVENFDVSAVRLGRADGVEFVDVLASKNADLVVLGKNVEFGADLALLVQRRKNNDLVKCLKLARPSVVGHLKAALRALKSTQKNVISHNLDNDSLAQSSSSPFLLDESQAAELLAPHAGFSQDCKTEFGVDSKMESCADSKMESRMDSKMESAPNFILEIGFGSGRNLLNLARENPHLIIIGVEIHTPSIEQVLRQIALQNLKNLYIINADARNLLYALPTRRCQAAFLHFPIPFNHAPHRRVISAEFFAQIARLLAPSGFLHIRSDDEVYAKDAVGLALALPRVDLRVAKNASHAVVSKYEARWERHGKDIFDVVLESRGESMAESVAESPTSRHCEPLQRNGVVIPQSEILSGEIAASHPTDAPRNDDSTEVHTNRHCEPREAWRGNLSSLILESPDNRHCERSDQRERSVAINSATEGDALESQTDSVSKLPHFANCAGFACNDNSTAQRTQTPSDSPTCHTYTTTHTININPQKIAPTKIIKDGVILSIDHIFESPAHTLFSLCFGDLNHPISRLFLVDKNKKSGRFFAKGVADSPKIRQALAILRQILA